MSNPHAQAGRVVTWLGVIKWALVALWGGYGVSAALVLYYGTTWPVIVLVGVVVACLAGALVSWVSVGYRQSSLKMLTIIAAPLPPVVSVSGGAGATWEDRTPSASTSAP